MGWTPGSVAVAAMGLLVLVSPVSARQVTERGSAVPGVDANDTVGGAPVLARVPRSGMRTWRVDAPAAQARVRGCSGCPPLWFAKPAGLPVGRSADQAIEHSDAYYTRLTIHRWGSYAMLPLFAGEYLLGNELLNGSDPAGWVRGMHGVGAGALGVLFGVNTITGVWNLVESRKDPGAFRRIVHSTLMLAADAGFAYTASLAGEREDEFENGFGGFRESEGDNRRHRDFALGSMALSTAGTLLMWLWR